MPKRSTKERTSRAKAHRANSGAGTTHEPPPRKPPEKSANNSPAMGRRKLRGKMIGLATTRKVTSRPQREIGQKRVGLRRQKRHGIERVEPTREPQIRAESFTSSKRILSTEARELLAKVDEGGIPLMMTRNLKRIASEHGITVGGDMTPDDVVRLLRDFARAGGTTMQTANGKQTSSTQETGYQGIEKAKKHPDIFASIIWPDMSDSNRDE